MTVVVEHPLRSQGFYVYYIGFRIGAPRLEVGSQSIAHSNGEERLLVLNGGFEPRRPPGKSTTKSPVEPFFISD